MPIDRELLFEILRLIPQVLWIVVLGIIFLRIGRPIIEFLMERLSGVEVFGFKLQLNERQVEQALGQRGGAAREAAASGILERGNRLAERLGRLRVLWVDDDPVSNVPERELLHRFGIFVESARSTAEAVEWLDQSKQTKDRPLMTFDLIVSDIARASDPMDGRAMLAHLRSIGIDLPLIFYVTHLDASRGTPAGSFGITTHPDELFHLIMDAVERLPAHDARETREARS